MSRRSGDAAIVAVVLLSLVAWVAALIVVVLVGRAMFDAAHDGDTALTIAYGVVLLMVVFSSSTINRSSK